MEDDIFEGLGVSDDADSEVCDTAPKALFFPPLVQTIYIPPPVWKKPMLCTMFFSTFGVV